MMRHFRVKLAAGIEFEVTGDFKVNITKAAECGRVESDSDEMALVEERHWNGAWTVDWSPIHRGHPDHSSRRRAEKGKP